VFTARVHGQRFRRPWTRAVFTGAYWHACSRSVDRRLCSRPANTGSVYWAQQAVIGRDRRRDDSCDDWWCDGSRTTCGHRDRDGASTCGPTATETLPPSTFSCSVERKPSWPEFSSAVFVLVERRIQTKNALKNTDRQRQTDASCIMQHNGRVFCRLLK